MVFFHENIIITIKEEERLSPERERFKFIMPSKFRVRSPKINC